MINFHYQQNKVKKSVDSKKIITQNNEILRMESKRPWR
jgi:hypothetical protein